MKETSYDLFCPNCNIRVSTKVIARGNGGASVTGHDLAEDAIEYYGDDYVVTICTRCNSAFLLLESRYSHGSEFSDSAAIKVIYPVESNLPSEGIPDDIARVYVDAVRSYKTSLYQPCALMCRLTLEALCGELQATGSNLKLKLDSLGEKEIVDKKMINWAHAVRLLGNEAAHDAKSVVSKEDAKDLLDFTEALLIYIFALNTKYDSFMARREQNR